MEKMETLYNQEQQQELKQISKRKEEWRPVKGYEGFYSISNYGRVFSHSRWVNSGCLAGKRKGKLISKKLKDKHESVILFYNGKRKEFYVQQLVARAFLPNPENKKFTFHLDGKTTNNRLNNLIWATNEEISQFVHNRKHQKVGV